jgi:hypothetical protein
VFTTTRGGQEEPDRSCPTPSNNYNSLLLNGSYDYLITPANSFSLAASGSLTVEGWVKANNVAATQTILCRSGQNGGYRLSLVSGQAQFELHAFGSTVGSVTGFSTLSTGVWHHVAGVFDGSNLKVYVDGLVDGQNQPSSRPGWDSSPTTSIGAAAGADGAGDMSNGRIDEVRVSSVALYTSSFTPSAHLTASGSTMALWKFDGQTAADSSGNGNNGSLVGSAAYSTDVPPNGGIGSNFAKPDSDTYTAQNSQPRNRSNFAAVVGTALQLFADLSGGFMPGVGVTPLSIASIIGSSGWFGTAAPPVPTQSVWIIHWLVTDQLGTPRMVFDLSGSLANVSRHDYLPFGEELLVGQSIVRNDGCSPQQPEKANPEWLDSSLSSN